MTGVFVNKLTVDRDYGFSQERRTIKILRYTGNQLAQRDMRKLIELIYRNFENIAQIKELTHNRYEIARLITSPQALVLIGTIDNKIISYLIAEAKNLDARRLMHIQYIFTSPVHRGHGVATYMLNLMQQYARAIGIETLSLTFDTYDKKLTKYYLDNHFEYDPELRTYQRYDMLVKYI